MIGLCIELCERGCACVGVCGCVCVCLSRVQDNSKTERWTEEEEEVLRTPSQHIVETGFRIYTPQEQAAMRAEREAREAAEKKEVSNSAALNHKSDLIEFVFAVGGAAEASQCGPSHRGQRT